MPAGCVLVNMTMMIYIVAEYGTYFSISYLSGLEPDNDDDEDGDMMVLPHTRNKGRVKNSQP